MFTQKQCQKLISILHVYCRENNYLEPGAGIRTPWRRMDPVEYVYLLLLVLCREEVYLEPGVGL